MQAYQAQGKRKRKMTEKQSFTINISLPTMNEIIASSKKHWSKYSTPKRGYTSLVAAIARRNLKAIRRYPVDVHCRWYCKDKRIDKDNIAAGMKYILDGLVESGIIEGDGWKHIGDIRHSFDVDKRNPRVEVELKY